MPYRHVIVCKSGIKLTMIASYIISQIYTKFSYSPTLDQKKLIISFSEFISESKNGDILMVNGYAGTGKTTVVAAVAKTLSEHKFPCFMLAPTGRAAKVMALYANEGAQTIHKKIYKQRSALVQQFELDRNTTKNGFFIVDEASMLSDRSFDNNIFGSGNLLEDLVKYVNSGDNCRLILIGDKAQLPPISHNESPALDVGEMGCYGNVRLCELSEVVRQQKDSGILHNATILREKIMNDDIGIPKFNLEFDDVKAITGSQFLEELETCYSNYGVDQTIVITRSNKQANRFNDAIRSRVIWQEEELSSGDLVMIVKNNYHYPPEDSNINFIANGDIARIVRLRRYEELYGFRFVNAAVKLPDYNDVEIDCKVILDTLHSVTPSLSNDSMRQLFEGVEKDYANITVKKERYKAIREDDNFNALQIKFAYAVTCHKSQGGQWDAVFVDKMIFGEEVMTKDLMRWLYTAMTRARKRLYFINFDDEFYINPPEKW